METLVEKLNDLNLAVAIVIVVLGSFIIYLMLWVKALNDQVNKLEGEIESMKFKQDFGNTL
jgi:Tfp pilus assembly protein PilO